MWEKKQDFYKAFLYRVGDFFHVLDLSFFVSGFMTYAALYVMGKEVAGLNYPIIKSGLNILFVFIMIYVCGLLSFAFGRYINDFLFRRREFNKEIKKAIKCHCLNGLTIEKYELLGEDCLSKLYARLWQEVVYSKNSSLIRYHLSRYWAMSAIYDGLGFSFICWLILVFLCSPFVFALIGMTASIVMVLFLLIVVFICFWQGSIYYKYQVGDLVAYVSMLRGQGKQDSVLLN